VILDSLVSQINRLGINDLNGGFIVSVWSPPSDAFGDGLIVSTIVSGHLEVLYGGEKGSEEAVLVG